MKFVLGLGTNCGDRLGYLRMAVEKLASRHNRSGLRLLRVSPIYQSDALLPEGAPADWNKPFLNLCILVESGFSPPELLKLAKKIENDLGRAARGRWAPREIDIDLLAMEAGTYSEDDLKIPHQELLKRPFALLPLADVAPDWELSRMARPWKQSMEAGSPDVPFHTRLTSHSLTSWMGIINITPDSFSDGGKFDDASTALKQAQHLLASGASILDLGAESTRPGATPVSPDLEWRRLQPALESILDWRKGLSDESPKVSVDTRHAQVAREALRLGADWINDVSGLSDPEMIEAVRDSRADLVFMHSLTVPPRKDVLLPMSVNPVDHLLRWAEERIKQLGSQGIDPDRLIFDPGIGFGTTPEQAFSLLRDIRKFHSLGVRLLVGHSRKGFIAHAMDDSSMNRDIETTALSQHLARAGVHYIRVHDVAMNARALKMNALVNGPVEIHP